MSRKLIVRVLRRESWAWVLTGYGLALPDVREEKEGGDIFYEAWWFFSHVLSFRLCKVIIVR